MATLTEAVTDFLAQKRIAVAGVSRDKNEAANVICRRLKTAGTTSLLSTRAHKQSKATRAIRL